MLLVGLRDFIILQWELYNIGSVLKKYSMSGNWNKELKTVYKLLLLTIQKMLNTKKEIIFKIF
jgi:hypothetical protein